MSEMLSEPLILDRAWFKAVVHAARVAVIGEMPDLDLSTIRAPTDPVEALWVEGIAARHRAWLAARKGAQSDRVAVRLLEVCQSLASRSECSITAIASALGVSTGTVKRRCRAVTGLAPMRFVQQVRVERARLLLLETTKSVKEVAAECGFPSTSALDHQFRLRFNQCPSDIRTGSKGT